MKTLQGKTRPLNSYTGFIVAHMRKVPWLLVTSETHTDLPNSDMQGEALIKAIDALDVKYPSTYGLTEQGALLYIVWAEESVVKEELGLDILQLADKHFYGDKEKGKDIPTIDISHWDYKAEESLDNLQSILEEFRK